MIDEKRAGTSHRAAAGLARALDALPRDAVAVRRRIETMEALLERSVRIPGLNYPVGLDAILGLVPVVGDVIAAALGGYIVWEARNLGMSRWQLARMAGNIGVDTVLGAVPLVGDLFDVAFRSNTRNLRIVRRHLDRHHPASAVVDASPGAPGG